jgi:hypothetical protein
LGQSKKKKLAYVLLLWLFLLLPLFCIWNMLNILVLNYIPYLVSLNLFCRMRDSLVLTMRMLQIKVYFINNLLSLCMHKFFFFVRRFGTSSFEVKREMSILLSIWSQDYTSELSSVCIMNFNISKVQCMLWSWCTPWGVYTNKTSRGRLFYNLIDKRLCYVQESGKWNKFQLTS